MADERGKSGNDEVAAAVAALHAGGLVILPTETVYGLAADASDARAVAAVYEAKGRPAFNPLIAHVADLATAQRIARFDERALTLAQRFWPGPLTLVLPARPLPRELTAGGATVGVRVPQHPVALGILEAAGVPLAVTSANRSGGPDRVTGAEVEAELGDRLSLVVDGVAPGGVPSTVLDLSGKEPVVLREGALSAAELAAALRRPVRGGHDRP